MTDTTRRAVVRTAAHAAWAVPVIAVATAAPAAAVGSGAQMLAVTGTLVRNVATNVLTFQNGSVANTGGRSTTAPLTLTIDLEVDPATGGDFSVSTVSTFPSGFSLLSAQSLNGTGTLIVLTTNATIAPNGTLPIAFGIHLLPTGSPGQGAVAAQDGSGVQFYDGQLVFA